MTTSAVPKLTDAAALHLTPWQVVIAPTDRRLVIKQAFSWRVKMTRHFQDDFC